MAWIIFGGPFGHKPSENDSLWEELTRFSCDFPLVFFSMNILGSFELQRGCSSGFHLSSQMASLNPMRKPLFWFAFQKPPKLRQKTKPPKKHKKNMKNLLFISKHSKGPPKKLYTSLISPSIPPKKNKLIKKINKKHQKKKKKTTPQKKKTKKKTSPPAPLYKPPVNPPTCCVPKTTKSVVPLLAPSTLPKAAARARTASLESTKASTSYGGWGVLVFYWMVFMWIYVVLHGFYVVLHGFYVVLHGFYVGLCGFIWFVSGFYVGLCSW